MRDPARIEELLATLHAIWEQQPDLRLGQLIVIGTRPSIPCPEVFNIEDDALLEGLRIYSNILKKSV